MKNTNVKNPIYFSEAILYKISDGFIEYNVTRKAHISAYVRVSGMNIHTLKELRKVMGEIDAPTPVPGIDHSHRTIGAAVTANLKLDSSGAVSAIEITEVNFRPVIGISWKGNDISTEYQDIAETFERIGAIAVFLPQLTSAHDAQAVLTAVDGIFMTGGSDLNPKLYGDQQTPHGSHSWNDVRDTSDFNLIRQAISLDVPMLCACRGLQVLNVVLGGALIQDIPYYLGQKVLEGEIDVDRVTKVLSGTLPGSDEHVKDTGYIMYNENYEVIGNTYSSNYPETYLEGSGCEEGHLRVQIDGIIHSSGNGYHSLGIESKDLRITKDSKWLNEIYSSETIELVSTSHHQAADPGRIGDGLSIAAVSSDGIIEALEYHDNMFALAVQWHPERFAPGNSSSVDVYNDSCNAVLCALIKYARLAASATSETT